jgi:hypothetical protein
VVVSVDHARDRAINGPADQGGLAGAGEASDDYHGIERERQVHAPSVAAAANGKLKPG